MTTASAQIPASVSPLSFLAGLALFVAVALVLAAARGLVRYLTAGHRAGMARLAAYEASTPDARRRARIARRTVIDASTGAVTVEPRRR